MRRSVFFVILIAIALMTAGIVVRSSSQDLVRIEILGAELRDGMVNVDLAVRSAEGKDVRVPVKNGGDPLIVAYREPSRTAVTKDLLLAHGLFAGGLNRKLTLVFPVTDTSEEFSFGLKYRRVIMADQLLSRVGIKLLENSEAHTDPLSISDMLSVSAQ